MLAEIDQLEQQLSDAAVNRFDGSRPEGADRKQFATMLIERWLQNGFQGHGTISDGQVQVQGADAIPVPSMQLRGRTVPASIRLTATCTGTQSLSMHGGDVRVILDASGVRLFRGDKIRAEQAVADNGSASFSMNRRGEQLLIEVGDQYLKMDAATAQLSWDAGADPLNIAAMLVALIKP